MRSQESRSTKKSCRREKFFKSLSPALKCLILHTSMSLLRCQVPGCMRTFKRSSDLTRHVNLSHKHYGVDPSTPPDPRCPNSPEHDLFNDQQLYSPPPPPLPKERKNYHPFLRGKLLILVNSVLLTTLQGTFALRMVVPFLPAHLLLHKLNHRTLGNHSPGRHNSASVTFCSKRFRCPKPTSTSSSISGTSINRSLRKLTAPSKITKTCIT